MNSSFKGCKIRKYKARVLVVGNYIQRLSKLRWQIISAISTSRRNLCLKCVC